MIISTKLQNFVQGCRGEEDAELLLFIQELGLDYVTTLDCVSRFVSSSRW